MVGKCSLTTLTNSSIPKQLQAPPENLSSLQTVRERRWDEQASVSTVWAPVLNVLICISRNEAVQALRGMVVYKILAASPFSCNEHQSL